MDDFKCLFLIGQACIKNLSITFASCVLKMNRLPNVCGEYFEIFSINLKRCNLVSIKSVEVLVFAKWTMLVVFVDVNVLKILDVMTRKNRFGNFEVSFLSLRRLLFRI